MADACTLADTVAGFAAASCGFEGPTLSGNMYFLRPTMGVKKLTCESRVVKNGKRIRVVEATIYGDNGQEISKVFWNIWICSVKWLSKKKINSDRIN